MIPFFCVSTDATVSRAFSATNAEECVCGNGNVILRARAPCAHEIYDLFMQIWQKCSRADKMSSFKMLRKMARDQRFVARRIEIGEKHAFGMCVPVINSIVEN